MYNGGKIIIGLLVFILAATFPVWYNAATGSSDYKPDPKIVTSAEQCVEPTDYMRKAHMDLLNEWRDEVVRGGARYFEMNGEKLEMSLTNTCMMKCHWNKEDFCDECHNYTDVDPYCWECHIGAEGGQVMGIDRRGFIKIAGLTALGAASAPGIKTMAQTEGEIPPGSLTAHRWAMIIDIRKCREQRDCSKCIDACHLTHNVPDFDNPKDEVKWIWKEDFKHVFHEQEHEHLPQDLKRQPVLVFCNHCDNPPCVRVCPTRATFKRDDGIVTMDMHRCIGCRYCVAACPYGSRSFNWREPKKWFAENNREIYKDFPARTRGVVEKCNFCADRLAKGKIPACVEACEAQAMVFGDLEDPDSQVREILATRFAIRRKPALGTLPQIYYLV